MTTDDHPDEAPCGARSDSRRRRVAAWTIFGALVGVLLWGGFNTVMEATNRPEFCVSCHAMSQTVLPEYEASIHFANASGVRAVCADCHVPRDWTHKLIRKVQASRELWHWALGTIDTPERFEAERDLLARREWTRMRASDSRECRNCHSFAAMDFHRQRPKSAEAMREAQAKGHTCIDCHKGIAHRLPDLAARHRRMRGDLIAAGPRPEVGAVLSSVGTVALSDAAEGGVEIARLAPATSVRVSARVGDRIRIEATAWRREASGRVLHARFGRRIAAVAVSDADRLATTTLATRHEPNRDETWSELRVEAWAAADAGWTDDPAGLDRIAVETFDAHCAFCHAPPRPGDHTAETWISHINAMRRMVPLDEDELALLLKYLQLRGKDAEGGDGAS